MNNEIDVRNVTEDLIDIHLDRCIAHLNTCSCPRCRADIRAFALNNFPQHYVVTDFGDAMARIATMSMQFQADIIAVITKAILTVSKNPRH